jgi:hypothetical protein
MGGVVEFDLRLVFGVLRLENAEVRVRRYKVGDRRLETYGAARFTQMSCQICVTRDALGIRCVQQRRVVPMFPVTRGAVDASMCG